jgi:Helix-turn-helix domain
VPENEKLLLDEHEAAEMLGVSVSTLRRNRTEKLPPDFILIRGAVRYALEDLQRFVERATRGR